MCSTPFGITDYIGPGTGRPKTSRSSSAQRLSASRIISVSRACRLCSANRLCSTPFGITDYIGRLAARRLGAGADVLNAFRHHGLYRRHPVADRRRQGEMRAQRLSASRIISVPVCGYHGPIVLCSTPFGITDYIGPITSSASAPSLTCAQRLSASRIISDQRPVDRVVASVRVLNAFRHHGLYRTCSIASRSCSLSSAQRLSASRIISEVHQAGRTGPRLLVLNAFRHHGLYRLGIDETRLAELAGAQRLSASRIISAPPPRMPAPPPPRVLNAFRHHGLYRHPVRRPAPEAHCAQRLSASRIISAGQRGEDLPHPGCSTPFGITDYIGLLSRQQRQGLVVVLNAFRHHGLYRMIYG